MALAFRRNLKNIVKNYTETEVKVREATSNDPWGPAGSLLSELSDLTYSVVALPEMMAVLWKRLGDQGKNWRHVQKSLIVLDYLVKTGSEKVLEQCRLSLPIFNELKHFKFVDKDGQDQGIHVREKAVQFIHLLRDDEKLEVERERSLKAKEMFGQPKSEFTSSSWFKRHSSQTSAGASENFTYPRTPPPTLLAKRSSNKKFDLPQLQTHLQHPQSDMCPLSPGTGKEWPQFPRGAGQDKEISKQVKKPAEQSQSALVDLSSAARSLEQNSRGSPAAAKDIVFAFDNAENLKSTNTSFSPLDPFDDFWSPKTSSPVPQTWSPSPNPESWQNSHFPVQVSENQFDNASPFSSQHGRNSPSFLSPATSLHPDPSLFSNTFGSQDVFDPWKMEDTKPVSLPIPSSFSGVGSEDSGSKASVRSDKTPETFLGSGANLVNLNNLFEPQSSSANPFLSSHPSKPDQAGRNQLNSPTFSMSPTPQQSGSMSFSPTFEVQFKTPPSPKSKSPPPHPPPTYRIARSQSPTSNFSLPHNPSPKPPTSFENTNPFL